MLLEESLWEKSPQWKIAVNLAESFVARGSFSDLSFQAFSTTNSPAIHLGTGKERGSEVAESPLYLIASLTKPVVAMAVLIAAQEGLFSLNERIHHYLPGWNKGEKRSITIRNLLSHTSGLPDQLSDNLEMRNAHASLNQFYQGILEVSLDYPPGTQAVYQSMGFVVLQKLMEKVTGVPLREYIHQKIFAPLEMTNSYLGFANDAQVDELLKQIAPIDIPEYLQGNAGDWNSEYWLRLGAPWGGMLSTPGDMLKFCLSSLACHSLEQTTVISAAMIDEASQNQLRFFESMNSRDQTYRPWGLGWRHNWKSHRETFGDLLSEETIGHWGATGCVMWIDLSLERACVICSTSPTAESRVSLIRLSNAIHTAMEEVDNFSEDDTEFGNKIRQQIVRNDDGL